MLGRIERYRLKKKASDTLNEVVELTPNLEKYSLAEEYQDLISKYNPDDSTSILEVNSSHDIARFATTPYNSKMQDKSWIENPIQGWATIASKSIYKSAGLDDLTEKISVFQHGNEPVIAFHINDNFNSIYDLVDDKEQNPNLASAPIQRSIDPLQVKQIAAMDFLMGNNERHGNNLMVSNNKDSLGYHSLLALDHGNNFQYVQPLSSMSKKASSDIQDSPRTFLANTSLNQALKASPSINKVARKLFHKWWADNSNSINNEFESQTSSLEESDVKEHVQRNFDRRFQMLQRWAAENEPNNFENTGFFDESYPNVVRIIPMLKTPGEIIKQIKNRLPTNDPTSAIRIIGEAFKKPRPSAVQKKLKDLFFSLMEDLKSNEIVELYDSVKGKGAKVGNVDMSFVILHHVVKTHDRRTARDLVRYDNGVGKIPPFWLVVLKNTGGLK